MEWSQTSKISLSPSLVKLSFLLVLVGYGLKAALVPGQSWLPDAHGEAPYPISALLSGVLLKSAVYAMLRLTIVTNQALGDDGIFAGPLLILYGLFSLALAVPLILGSLRFKRVLAEHTLLHVSLSVCGIGVGLLGSKIALIGAILHLTTHALTKTLMFLDTGTIQAAFFRAGIHSEKDIRGVLKLFPRKSILLGLGGLALVGSPWFGIFISELMILAGIIQKLVQSVMVQQAKGIDALLMIVLIVFVTSIYLIYTGMVHHIKGMLLGKPPQLHSRVPDQNWQGFAILLFFIFMIGIGILRLPFLDLLGLLIKSANRLSGS